MYDISCVYSCTLCVGGMYHMYIYSASMSKSSGSSVGNNIRLKLKRPVFESQLDQKFFPPFIYSIPRYTYSVTILCYMYAMCLFTQGYCQWS